MDKLVAIDFETANGYKDSACSLGLVELNNKKIINEEHYYIQPSMYYNDDSNYDDDPFYDYNFKYTYLHNISWTDVSDADDFSGVWQDVEDTIKSADYIIAHNHRFEKDVIDQCCDYYGLEVPSINWLCSMSISRSIWSIYPTKLSDVCEYLNIELEHHDALSDAKASAEILIKAFQNGYKIQI